MTRVDSTTGEYHNTSAHFLWIGDRTRQLDGAHVEYCKGIKNPLGIKCGPSSDPKEIVKLTEVLNPDNEAGRITLIARFGHDQVTKFLPKLIFLTVLLTNLILRIPLSYKFSITLFESEPAPITNIF